MDMLETALNEKKDELNMIIAPEEMETHLRQALQKKKRTFNYKPVAAVLIAALILSYSFDTLAYYGKKFTGYDQMMVGSLKQLNEEGRGQEINKTCTFSNGVEVTIDGIMFDGNELVAFYKLHSTGGKLQDVLNYNLPRLHLKGLKPEGYMFTGGYGMTIDDQTMNMVDTLEPPLFYEKWMSIDIQLVIGKNTEIRTINFTLDRNKAMSKTAKKELNAEAKLGDYRILFNSLTSSAMSTVINGSIIPSNEAAMKAFMPQGTDALSEMPQLRFDIVSDDGQVSQFSGNQGASNNNITFSSRTDALPKDFKTLQLRNIRLETMAMVDKTVDVNQDSKELQIDADMILKKVYQDKGDTSVIISSRGIPVMGLFEGEKQIEQVNPDEYKLEAESAEPVDRVYRFKGTSDNLKLMTKFIRYSKFSADTVDIPIE